MLIALDCSALSIMLKEFVHKEVEDIIEKREEILQRRMEHFFSQQPGGSCTLVIPTPSWAELMTCVPDIHRISQRVDSDPNMYFADFNSVAATEYGLLSAAAIASGDKKSGSDLDWGKVKFDRQIAVVAKLSGAELLLTRDKNQSSFAEMVGLTALNIDDPQPDRQPGFDFGDEVRPQLR